MGSRHAEWKAEIARTVRALGGTALSKLGTAHEGRGWPDLFVAHARGPRGGFWLELKVGRDKLRDEQSERIEMLRKGGAHAWVLHEVDGEHRLYLEGGSCLQIAPAVSGGASILSFLDVLKGLAKG